MNQINFSVWFWLLVAQVATTTANAAHFYVREGATGTRSGANWTDAYTNFNNISWGSVAAGDSIWIAGGTYQTLSVGASGTTNNPIYIARVRTTNATPAAATGWNSSFDSLVTIGGTAPVTVTGRDFITIDGQIPYGGILITNTAATNDSASRYSVSIGSGSDYFSLLNTKVRLCNRAYNVGSSTYDRRCVNVSYSTANIAYGMRLAYNDFAEGDTLFSILFQTAMTVEHNLFHDNNREATIGPHQNVWQTVGCTNVIFRYNMVTNYQEECIMMCFVSSSDAPNDTWHIYGNLFSDGTENSRVLESQYVTNRNIFFYNNTIANTEFLAIRAGGTANGGYWAGCVSTNNIMINSGTGGGVGFGLGTDDYNLTDGTTVGANSISSASASIFVDDAGRDYRLVSTISATTARDKGRSLSASGQTLSVDAAGNTRGADGTWDLGWLEYDSGGYSPTIVTNNASGARVMGFRGLGMSVLPVIPHNHPATPLLFENFEGSGYATAGWSEYFQGSGNSINEDNTTNVLSGDQSLALVGISDDPGFSTNSFAASSTVYGYFQFKCLKYPNEVEDQFRQILALYTDSGTAVFRIRQADAGGIYIETGGSADVALIGPLTLEQTYHIWWSWTKDNGSNSAATLSISTDKNKPTSGDGFVSITGTQIATDASVIMLGYPNNSEEGASFNGAPSWIYDYLLLDNEEILSYP